jgi:beta-glucanase (GH16 family)
MKQFANLMMIVTITGAILMLISCNSHKSQNVKEIPSPKIEGDFLFIPELSDEFEGNSFDITKWFPNNPGWDGRQPAFFSEKNVNVSNGTLNLTMRKEEPTEELKKKGYHTYSSAAVRSKHTIKYGYFEIKAKAMNSNGSSAFWFFHQTPGLWTEIDVFELCGTCELQYQYNMNLHVFRTPLINKHWSKGSKWKAPYRFADDFHVFGLEWTPYVIRWYVDGEAVSTAENTHWHQPLTMNFDSETMPDWLGLPDDKDLPSTFRIEYVRSWKHKTAEWMDEGLWKK